MSVPKGSVICALGACVCCLVLKTLVSSPFWVFIFVMSYEASQIFILNLPNDFTNPWMSCFVDMDDFFVNYTKHPKIAMFWEE